MTARVLDAPDCGPRATRRKGQPTRARFYFVTLLHRRRCAPVTHVTVWSSRGDTCVARVFGVARGIRTPRATQVSPRRGAANATALGLLARSGNLLDSGR